MDYSIKSNLPSSPSTILFEGYSQRTQKGLTGERRGSNQGSSSKNDQKVRKRRADFGLS